MPAFSAIRPRAKSASRLAEGSSRWSRSTAQASRLPEANGVPTAATIVPATATAGSAEKNSMP
ncbi:hypothetical protein WEB32_03445 [Streptomyces netropsis]